MITATFTDPQGTVQTDAVLYLRTANYYNNTNEFYLLNSSNFTSVTNEPPENTVNINYSFYYWINAAAKTAGAAPYILANSSEMDMDFSFTPDATYDGLTLEAKCEKHLVDVVLPPMQA
jgi:hypothetical protein